MIIVFNGGASNPNVGSLNFVSGFGSAGAVTFPITARGWIKTNQIRATSRTGPGPKLMTQGLTAIPSGHLAMADALGDFVDGGTPGGGSGTVTSVAMTVPSDLSVSGSPVTTSGTLAITANTQSANLVKAGPSSGGAATPTYRALVAADLPNTAVTPGSYTATNLTVDAQGRITAAANGTGSSVTLETNGTNNASQSVLDLVQQGPITIVDNGSGHVSIGYNCPTLASFTWVNQGTSTATQTVSGGPILMQIVDSSSINWRGLFVNQPSTPYKVMMQFRMGCRKTFVNSQTAGIYFYDGTKLMGLEFLSQTTPGGLLPRIEKITNVNTDNSTPATLAPQSGSLASYLNPFEPLWVQLRNSGSTIYFDYSWDGVNFTNMYSEAIATFITPTKIGWGGISVTSDAANWVINNLLNWRTVGNATL